jgi:hypothetical protein
VLRALRRREAGGGRAVSLGSSESCRRGVVEQLLELHRNSVGYLRRDGLAAEDAQFYAEQNACLVADAEQCYRTMFAAHVSSWNLRDTHMADGRQSPGPPPTPRGAREAHRLGAQLPCRRCAADTDGRVRRTQPRPAHPIAIPGRRGARGVYDLPGAVTAASAWDAPAERKRVHPALPESYERLFHEHEDPRFLLRLTDGQWRFGVANAAPGTRDRRHLPSGDGASEPLLPGPDRLPVRRRHPSRRDPRGGAAGADRRVGVR